MVETQGRRKVNTNIVKFLCSYGGKILPTRSNGQLRYIGGVIRVLSVDRSISLIDLLVKLEGLCGSPVSLQCQLPNEDLDTLVTIISDAELALIMEEYDWASKLASTQMKIRAFLAPPKSMKKVSPPPVAIVNSSRDKRYPAEKMSQVVGYPTSFQKFARTQLRDFQSVAPGITGHGHLVYNGNYRQY